MKQLVISLAFVTLGFIISDDGKTGGATTTYFTYNVGKDPFSIIPADFNNDGNPDLAVANRKSNNVSILIGKGDGTFKDAVDYAIASNPFAIAVCDFNKDGKTDLISASATAVVLLGKGDGTFTKQPTDFKVISVSAITFADFNKDDLIDIAVGHDGRSISVYLGDGKGKFNKTCNFIANNSSLYCHDMDLDGSTDIITLSTKDDSMRIFKNDSKGNFSKPSVEMKVGKHPTSLAVADLNNDSKNDIVVANLQSNNISVLIAEEKLKFAKANNLNVEKGPVSITTADFRSDGEPELVITNSLSNSISMLFNKAGATFSIRSIISNISKKSPNTLAYAVYHDLNKDGEPDCIAADSKNNDIIVINTVSSAIVKSDKKPKKGNKVLISIETSMGNIEVELNRKKAPATVENFLKYLDDGFYNGTIFHRVINNFMVQGGGFTSELTPKSTRQAITNEADNGLRNLRGTIAMARLPHPDTATSQFYINHMDNSGLDHRDNSMEGYGYCVFGKVTKGMDVVDKIASVKTTSKNGLEDVPEETITIKKISRIQQDE
ncbi:MAG: peptidylprolyl isomerase [Planctomycetes bacterium]|nr:peptidylprolyl isomerase [Planctomycetota bacterium]